MPKKRKAKPIEGPVFYVTEIDDWGWSFSFGLDKSKYSNDPYSDYRHLEIRGSLLSPTNMKAEQVVLHLLPDTGLNEEHRRDNQPIAVGSLRLNDGTLQGLISMPQDALDSLLNMLTARKFKFIVMQGRKLRYRQTKVVHYRFQRELDEDDLPTNK